MILHTDNTSVIKITTNHVQHENTKHIEVDHHYIHKFIVDSIITLQHISFHDQLVNLFSKTMTHTQHNYLFFKLLLCDHQSQFKEKILGNIIII